MLYYNHTPNLNRRQFLTLSASATAALLTLKPELSYARIIQEFEGAVWINQDRANPEALIHPGDTIRTGANSKIIFVMGKDVYKLGPHSILQLEESRQNKVVKVVRLIEGALTAVFGKGNKEIQTSTANLGIRGTGIFLKIEQDRTYFCDCYGETEVITTDTPPQRQTIVATHHKAIAISHEIKMNQPRFSPDTLREHTDDDLIYLESFRGSRPPASFK